MEIIKIYNQTYKKWFDWYMSNYDPHVGNEFPKARWRHEQEADQIAQEKATLAIKPDKNRRLI